MEERNALREEEVKPSTFPTSRKILCKCFRGNINKPPEGLCRHYLQSKQAGGPSGEQGSGDLNSSSATFQAASGDLL